MLLLDRGRRQKGQNWNRNMHTEMARGASRNCNWGHPVQWLLLRTEPQSLHYCIDVVCYSDNTLDGNPPLILAARTHVHGGWLHAHGAIEFAKRNVQVYSPHEWHNIFRSARRHRPYEVQPLHYDFFDLREMSRMMMRECAVAKIHWMKAKCLKFEKEKPAIIQFRYSHDGDYDSIDVCGRTRGPRGPSCCVRAYKNPLPISKAKYDDLQKLCSKGTIPRELHGWFADLPSANSAIDATTGSATTVLLRTLQKRKS